MLNDVLRLIFLVFLIAGLSIGIEAYNRHPDYKKNNMSSFNFLVIMLTVVILNIVYNAFSIYRTRFSPVGMLTSTFVSP